jgi:hypothetical protein
MEALLTPELLYKMEDRRLDLDRLRDMSAGEIGAFLRHPAAGEDGVLVNRGWREYWWAMPLWLWQTCLHEAYIPPRQ